MKKLHISPDLALPIEFLTSTQAIVAKKRVGKSYTAMVEAEELLEAKQQVVVLDPTGAWWGLRSSADGKSPGYPITILGGDHGDVPLEATAGATLAEAIVADQFSAVVDLTSFKKGERLRFAADFLETLYRLNREAMHLFLDEADVFAPQKTFSPEQARCLGAADELVRRGGIRGIGVTLISQRPQVINKDVLSQIDMLVVLRMNHPKDIGAIRDWVVEHVDQDTAKAMLASLVSLPKGEAWVWAPAEELFARVTIREKRTFDSGRTPKAGERRVVPKVLAPVDLARLGKTIAATVERVKANDPTALKARVAELERQLARPTAAAAPAPKVERVEVPVFKEAEIKRFEKALADFDDRAQRLDGELQDVRALVVDLRRIWSRTESNREVAARHFAGDGKVTVLAGKHQIRVHAPRAAARPAPVGTGPGDAELGSGERKILTALAQYAPASRTKQQVAILTGYAHNGGGFNNYVSALRGRGYLDGSSDALRITDAGLRALGSYQPLPTGRALLDHWMGQVGKAEREVLRVLDEEWPTAQPKEYVAIKAGYAPDGGGFNNALSRLRTLELIMGKAKLVLSGDLRDGAS